MESVVVSKRVLWIAVCIGVCAIIGGIGIFLVMNSAISVPIQDSVVLYGESGNMVNGEIDLSVECHPSRPFRYSGTVSLDGVQYESRDKRLSYQMSSWDLWKEKREGYVHTELWQSDIYETIEILMLDIYFNERTEDFYISFLFDGQYYWGSTNESLSLDDIKAALSTEWTENGSVFLLTEETLKRFR